MLAYILKRLLMVPTLLGVLLLTFVVIQFVPGGPVEQYLAEAKAGIGGGGRRRWHGLPRAQGWTRSGWSRSRPCTALTSRARALFSDAGPVRTV
jgi:ABC-type microcin C transport system permease subunit YejB